jgi:hypothetical protein
MDLFEGFAEDPSRYAWLNMPPARVRTFRRMAFAGSGS